MITVCLGLFLYGALAVLCYVLLMVYLGFTLEEKDYNERSVLDLDCAMALPYPSVYESWKVWGVLYSVFWWAFLGFVVVRLLSINSLSYLSEVVDLLNKSVRKVKGSVIDKVSIDSISETGDAVSVKKNRKA